MDILYKLKHNFFFVLYEMKLNIFNFKNFMYKIPQNIRKFILKQNRIYNGKIERLRRAGIFATLEIRGNIKRLQR